MMNPHHTKMLMHALSAAVTMKGGQHQVEHGRTKLRALQIELSHRETMMETQLSHQKEMFGLRVQFTTRPYPRTD